MQLTYCIAVLLIASLADAENNASKFTVAFHFEGLGYRCLGGIISDRYVLSVGECFATKWGYPIRGHKITAIAGAKDLFKVDGLAKSDVEEVFFPWSHQWYTERNIHDFAIVKLKDSLNLTTNGLIALNYPAPSNRNNFTKVGVVAGYMNGTSNVLQYENVSVVSYRRCFHGVPQVNSERRWNFCIRREKKNCSSDRGSPYVDGNVIIGVQMKCDNDSPFELYKKVSSYSKLITKVLKNQPGFYSQNNYS